MAVITCRFMDFTRFSKCRIRRVSSAVDRVSSGWFEHSKVSKTVDSFGYGSMFSSAILFSKNIGWQSKRQISKWKAKIIRFHSLRQIFTKEWATS
jgi:hypothetical protein